MAETSNHRTVVGFFNAMNDHRVDDAVALLHPDIVQEWPQSGERFRGRDNIKAALTNYPGLPTGKMKEVVGAEDSWVLTPSWTPLRVVGSGDDYTIEGYLTYPNGERWNWVAIAHFRDGLIQKLTEYFAAPFPAAEWRSKWAEKMESSPT